MNEYLSALILFFNKYVGKTVDDLFKLLGINSNAKSKNYMLALALLNSYEGKELASIKIDKYKIRLKTIQLRENGKPKEAMSFSPIAFDKIINETWDNSDFKNYLNRDFIIFVFGYKDGKNALLKVFDWHIPESDLNGEVKLVWEDTKKKISEGTIIKEINGNKIKTWFLGESVTNICHVRPHGSSGADITKLPVPDRQTGYHNVVKHSFWFNHDYLNKIINMS